MTRGVRELDDTSFVWYALPRFHAFDENMTGPVFLLEQVMQVRLPEEREL